MVTAAHMKNGFVAKLLGLIGLLSLLVIVSQLPVFADSPYGNGTYGSCQYGSCSITLTSNGTVNVNVTPTTSATCTVQSDSIAVTTDASTGYTLTLADSAASSQMTGSNGGTITPISGTRAVPASLSANTWGYRVDGVGGFGAGPTSASTNAGIPSLPFAGVPNSSATADTVASTTSSSNPATTTVVWYGLCADTSIPSGTYSSSVVYTAVTN